MGLVIDQSQFGQTIQVTSPQVKVEAQDLADFIEDYMSSPAGLTTEDIINPQGKIEDPGNLGVFSQIILLFNSPWQIQFWGGSGYTQIIGGKLVGGLADEVMKATGTAGDITVLVSPVDGITVATANAIDASDVAEAVMDELLQGHFTPDSVGEALTLIRGMVQSNYMLDNTEFNAQGMMTAGRMRLFSSKALVDSATDGGAGEGELASFTIGVEVDPVDGSVLETYKVTRDP